MPLFLLFWEKKVLVTFYFKVSLLQYNNYTFKYWEIWINYIYFMSTLLKIKVLKRFFTVMPQKNHFWFHREPFSQRFFKEPSLSYLFIIWRTFFHHKKLFWNRKVPQMLTCSCDSVVEHCVSSAKVVGSIPREHILTIKTYYMNAL